MTEPRWVAELEPGAPDVVACWRVLDDSLAGLKALHREVRARVRPDGTPRILAQQEAVADALEGVLRTIPEGLLRAPGGEEDWNVAQAFAHTTASRRWLAHAGAVAARGEWPANDPPVVRPGIPGPADASRDLLQTYLDKSRRSMATSAVAITGHETDRCPLDHPLVGHLSCGGWLLFAGVHDVMHLDQLHRLMGDR